MEKTTFKYSRNTFSIICFAMLLTTSCKKFVDIDLPADKITADGVFTNDASAIAGINGVYYYVNNTALSTVTYPALFSDELTMLNASGLYLQSQENSYDPTSPDFGFFTNYYKAINAANAILENVDKSVTVTDSIKKQVKGEAAFLRAFCHFKLLNLYGNVPLITMTDVTKTATQGNTPLETIYKGIIADLNSAYDLVADRYPSDNRARANKNVVSALLAKVYLYHKEWANAETAATRVITATGDYSLPNDLNTIFQAGSNETIWQLWNQNGYTSVGVSFIPSVTSTVSYQVRDELLDAFEENDKRKTAWLKAGTDGAANLYYPYKYKQRTTASGTAAEYQVQLRLGELYLIRAEARAQQDDVPGAMEDLTKLRERTGLLEVTADSQEEALLKVEQERRVELFCEEGNRWFDLNRTGRTEYWLELVKTDFPERAVLLPYPQNIVNSNPNLIQNTGY